MPRTPTACTHTEMKTRTSHRRRRGNMGCVWADACAICHVLRIKRYLIPNAAC